MALHHSSILLIASLVSFVLAITQISYGFFVHRYRPSLEMGIATLLFALRMVFYIYEPILPDFFAFFPIIAIGFEVMFVYRSIRGSLEYPITVPLDLIIFFLAMLLGILSCLYSSYSARQVIQSVYILYFFGKALVLSLRSRRKLFPSVLVIISIYLIVFAAVMLYRGLYYSVVRVPEGLYPNDPRSVPVTIISLLLFVLGNLGLFIVAITRTMDRYREQRDFARTLISTIGHDLNGYLAGIRQVTEIIENQTDPVLPMIVGNTRKAENLLTDLVYWGRSRDQSSIQETSPVLLNNLITGVLQDASSYMEIKNLSILNNGPARTEPVSIDLVAAKVVLRNILSNAVKFSPNGAVLTISYPVKVHHQGLSISDQGPGMPPQIKKEVIAGHPVSSRDGSDGEKGMGMGLRIVTSVCRAYGWAIDIHSAPANGTTVTVWFPSEDLLESS